MKRFKITDILIGILFTLLFISIAVVFTINFRPLYYMDVHLLKIDEISGFDKSDILANYNALIDYSSPFFRGDLKFPTLEASQSGLQHFVEVKNIFTSFYILGAITLIIGIIIILYKRKRKDISYLFVSAITSIVIPILVAIYMAIDFNRAFVVFHKIFFNNDDWLFDPTTDPVILILPEEFFMHCAILIIILVLLFCSAFLLLYYKKKSHVGIKHRKNSGLKI